MHPILFSVPAPSGALAFTSYAALMYLGLALGTWAAVRRAPADGIPRFDAFAASALGAAAGLLGARVTFLLVNLPAVLRDPLFYLGTRGGYVFYGGLLAGAAAVLAYLRHFGLSAAAFGDAAAPGLALGHGLGRVGCFLAGCCYGRPTTLPWGARFPESATFFGPAGVPLHPVQLYEALGNGLLGVSLWMLGRRLPRGATLALYLLGYALLRATMELFFRGDDRGFMPLGFPVSLVLSAALALGACAWLGRRWVANALTTETKVS